jgi:hypothetical protein
MPRRSAQEIAATDLLLDAPRLPPPPHLSEDERRGWEAIVAQYPPSHFGSDNAALLEELCVHQSLAQQLAVALRETRTWNLVAPTAAGARRREAFNQLLAAARAESTLICSLMTKLRLAPSTRRNDRVNERRLDTLPQGPKPWESQRQ